MRLASLCAIAAVLLGAASFAAASELPPRAPGLWETSIKGPKRLAINDCVGATDPGFARRLAGTGCEYRVSKTPAGHLIESACPLAGGMRATARTSIGGDYATAVGGVVSNELVDVRTKKVLSRGKTSISVRRLRDCRPEDR